MKNIRDILFDDNPNLKEIINDLNSIELPLTIDIKGLSGSSKAFFISYLFKKTNKLNWIILQDKEKASYFYDDIIGILGDSDVYFFPSAYKNTLDYQTVDHSNIVLKTEVLNKIEKNLDSGIIVSYPEAIMEKVLKLEQLSKNTLNIAVGDNLSMDFIIDVLNEYAFDLEDFVYEPGKFSIRGSIIDVFSYSDELPYRIDFFGDRIESIRSFDPNTQLSTIKHHNVNIIPNINNSFSVADQKTSIFELISENSLFFLDQPELINDKIKKSYNFALSNKDNTNEKSDNKDIVLNISDEKDLLNEIQFADNLKNFTKFIFSYDYNNLSDKSYTFRFEAQPSFNKQFDLLIDRIQQNEKEFYSTFILSNNQKQLERLHDIFTDKGVKLNYHSILLTVHEGFVDNDSRTCIYTDHQIFERYHKYAIKTIARKDAITVSELNSLKPGDYVVHVDNGIGKFGGLQKINNNGKIQEVISIIYENNDILFVNIHSLHRISKYRSKEGEPPKLHRLGSAQWKRLKEKTKKNIKDIARDLILLYAKRREQKGYAFSEDSYLQHELESSFIYEDTPDQVRTNESIKADMESLIPMDRLVCGDVGFGKTELAIRAAFKAVNDSKQVAVLVPTTVLALQHYQTFSQRLKDFPVNIEYLTRLKTSKESNQIIKDINSGKVDIVIGTHKLVNKVVEFKDLGLLIIDEEQKFGVAIKEKLKLLKLNIDTLTLTATPIPRTLQFSLMGARDLSVINTPPANRQAIHTELHTFNSEIIKEAIYAEVQRNGQVFFVNNRIRNIFEIETLINKLCPDVKTIVAHGQLDGVELERIILEFMKGEYDVLISTSIIENGVDIPNANTIIINNAHTFGLSDLHQMRGRVGRSNKRAFCYLLAPPVDLLTPEARRRLRTIEEFNELGSGINIALQDLDIRGSGNILGSEQSGFIADIGFETYNKILNETLEELKEDEFKEVFKDSKHNKENTIKPVLGADCQINVDMEILIPDNYISSTAERIKLYKELDEITSEDELEYFRERMNDRFGSIPEQTEQMFEVVRLRWSALKLGFQKITIQNNTFIGYFPLNQKSSYYSSDTFSKIIEYVQQNPNNISIKQQNEKLTLRIVKVFNIKQIKQILDQIIDSLID